jgi:hypothetical protein
MQDKLATQSHCTMMKSQDVTLEMPRLKRVRRDRKGSIHFQKENYWAFNLVQQIRYLKKVFVARHEQAYCMGQTVSVLQLIELQFAIVAVNICRIVPQVRASLDNI